MKIEKLTENKIRVIIHSDELGLTNINVHNLMAKAIEKQDIFSYILKKAEKEVDFNTDGCKLLIETFSSLEDIFVFTITRYLPENDLKKRKLMVKRKSFDAMSQQAIGSFENFDAFCDFCKALNCSHKINGSQLAKTITLYLWKNTYYLVLKNINTKFAYINLFYSTLSEFGKLLSPSSSFESKLVEHGTVIIKKNAIATGINFFAN